MDKPVVMQVREVSQNIVDLLNESKLPAFILKTEVEKIYNLLCQLEVEEYTKAVEEYENAQKEKESDK